MRTRNRQYALYAFLLAILMVVMPSLAADTSPTVTVVAPSSTKAPLSTPAPTEVESPSYEVEGIASWYTSDRTDSLTANGEIFNPSKMTAAHKEMKFGTLVEVHNLNNGKKTTVRINDRGPYVAGRIIDLTPEAAKAIDMFTSGIAPVELTIVYEPKIPESQYNRAGDTGWYNLQLGAYSNTQVAWSLYQKLMDAGLKPTVEIVNDSLVRLSVRWAAAYQLDRTMKSLSALGIKEADILKKGEYSPFEE